MSFLFFVKWAVLPSGGHGDLHILVPYSGDLSQCLHSVPSNSQSIRNVAPLTFIIFYSVSSHLTCQKFLLSSIYYETRREEAPFFCFETVIKGKGNIGINTFFSRNLFSVCFLLPGHGEPEQELILGKACGSCQGYSLVLAITRSVMVSSLRFGGHSTIAGLESSRCTSSFGTISIQDSSCRLQLL